MVIDTSAILAILFDEPEAAIFAGAIEADPIRLMSAANVFEAMVVVEARKGQPGARELDLFLHKASINIVAFDSEQVEIARKAWRKYGKGNHPANLNFGDCFAYSLARTSDEPLLFKDDAFNETDVQTIII